MTGGSHADPAVTDPTLAASDIALLKGILSRLGGSASSVPLLSTPAGALAVATAFGSIADANGSTIRAWVDSAGAQAMETILPVLWNGTNLDRQRNNHEVTVFASAARTTLQDSADLINYNSRGCVIAVDITVWTAGGLTITVQEKDTLSGKYNAILTSAVLGAAATTWLTIYPGVTVAANVAASAPLPRIFKVHVAVVDATSITYSIGCNFIL